MQATIAFIGVGNMASAIIGGLIRNGYSPQHIVGTSRTESKRQSYQEKFGIRMVGDNAEAVAEADWVVLCVKPAQMKDVIAGFREKIRPEQLFISVAAGLELSSLQAWLGKVAVVRSMPNTPAQLRAGMTGLIANTIVSEEQKGQVSDFFAAVGQSVWVSDEAQMHTVTALAGSAPAYFFRFLEAMVKAGEKQGLSRDASTLLASQTMLGAARMVMETEESIEQLRINITSPKGTTEQALLSLESNHIDSLVESAVEACVTRSKELARQFAND